MMRKKQNEFGLLAVRVIQYNMIAQRISDIFSSNTVHTSE